MIFENGEIKGIVINCAITLYFYYKSYHKMSSFEFKLGLIQKPLRKLLRGPKINFALRNIWTAPFQLRRNLQSFKSYGKCIAYLK